MCYTALRFAVAATLTSSSTMHPGGPNCDTGARPTTAPDRKHTSPAGHSTSSCSKYYACAQTQQDTGKQLGAWLSDTCGVLAHGIFCYVSEPSGCTTRSYKKTTAQYSSTLRPPCAPHPAACPRPASPGACPPA